jgi:hypothetical protein
VAKAGAVRAGLLDGLATRYEGGMSDVVVAPHVVAERLDDVVERLLLARVPSSSGNCGVGFALPAT